MELKSLSASSMTVWEACPARYGADRIAGRAGQVASRPAQIGLICHGAKELYVQKVYIDHSAPAGKETLEACLLVSYKQVMGSLDTSSSEYIEALGLSLKWMKRTDFSNLNVLSVEDKRVFPLPFKYGTVNFTYIFDRFDQFKDRPDEYQVTDYKSLQQPLGVEALRKKLQARVYAVMAMIMHPDAKRIWVTFDMLRWEGEVSTSFSREECIEMYRRMQRVAAEIHEADPDKLPERLNSNCVWCVRKTSCEAARANIKAGGKLAHSSLPEVIELRALLDFQKRAAENAIKELDEQIMALMQESGQIEYNTDLIEMKIKVQGRRSVDAEIAQELMQNAGLESLYSKYAKEALGMRDFDALLNDPELPGEIRAQLENLITKTYGDPRVATSERRYK